MFRKTTLICGLLLLAVGLVFGQTIRQEFVNLDDDVCVSNNPQVTHGLSARAIGWAFTHRLVGNWDPLTWISHTLDWDLYGPKAGGHHLTNVLLHAATTLLLFLVLRQMTAGAWPSALAAALWAIHPLRVESVAWVTERKDVLSGLFGMLTLLAYGWYARCAGAGPLAAIAKFFGSAAATRPADLLSFVWYLLRTSLLYLLVVLFFALGLMAKPMLVTLPFVLLLLDYWPLGRMVSRRVRACTHAQDPQLPARSRVRASTHPTAFWLLLIEKLPLLALAAVCCAITVWAQRVPEYHYGDLWWRIGDALISYVVYLRQFFCPAGLALLYPRRGPVLPPGEVFGAGLVLLGVTAAVWAWRRKCPYLLVGWLWYLGMLLPVVGLLPFGGQMAADRFTYLPQIGISIGLAWGAADWRRLRPYGRWVCGVGSALALAALMGCAWQQTSYWRDSETLWTRSLACTSGNYRVHNLLGNALATRGRIDEAIAQFQKSLEIEPHNAVAQYSLGVAAAGRGQMDEALDRYRQAIAADPGYAIAQNNLGNALFLRGQLDEAVTHFLAALRIRPDFAEAYYNLGNALFVLGRSGEAMTQYEKALEFRPDYAEAHYNLGLLLEARGRVDEAVAHYRKVQEIQARQSLGAK